MCPSGLCRPQNHEMHAGADETQPGRHILKVGILLRTTGIPKEWVERGGTITLTISRQYIGGATKKKDQQGWTADGRSSSLYSINLNIRVLMPQECASCVRAPGSNRHVVGNERVLQERSSEPS